MKVRIVMLFLVIIASIVACRCDQLTDSAKPEGYLHRFRLSGGRDVECNYREFTYCGYNLTDCKDGSEFLCQINLEQLP